MKKLPDLEAWALFAKVAETGSFARTAAEFDLSQATVSKAILRLEKRMGTVLFHRNSRRLSLTESGYAALERATRILAEGEAIEAEVAEQSVSLRGPIRITVPMSFGLSYLAPILPEFMTRLPDVSFDFHFGDEIVDLVANRFDLGLRISTMADSSLLARRLYAVKILLVGAPAYFERYGKPNHPRELAQHRGLMYSNSRTGGCWRFRHAQHGEFTQAMQAPLCANNAEAMMPALKAGLGLALQPEFLVWDELQSGELETVMCDWKVDPIALHIVTPPGRSRPARVQAFIDFLSERLAEAPWLQEIARNDG